MRLQCLKLRNFKGIRDFTLDASNSGNSNCDILGSIDGAKTESSSISSQFHGDIEVWGDNATGKTTLFNAFTYLLFDKDSANRADFEIKTLDAEGKAIPGLDHEVEAVLVMAEGLDSENLLTLRKVYKEKWTKKRGSAQAEFTGHTTDHYIDSVPVPKGEYQEFIGSLIDEEAFRLLTNPRYFPEVLSWQKRRDLLLSVCGDVSDADVIASDATLANLPDILGNRSLEDHRKVIASKRTEINKQLQAIPVRIDEANRALPVLPDGVNEDSIRSEITSLEAQRQKKQGERVTVEKGGAIAENTKALREVEAQLLDIANKHRARLDDDIKAAKKQLMDAHDKGVDLTSDQRQKQGEINDNIASIGRLEAQLEAWRDQWRRINRQEFVCQRNDTCPTCGQALPPEQVQSAQDKALADFNQDKASRLEQLNGEGKTAKARVSELEIKNNSLAEEISGILEQIATLESQGKDAQAKITDLQATATTYAENPECVAKSKEKAALEQDIEGLKAGNSMTLDAIAQGIVGLDLAIESAESTLAQVAQREKGLVRVKELKAEERTLAASYEALEGELYLTEQFVRSKVRLLEDKINSKFRVTKWKLFEEQINGAINEICEATLYGVPYASLNHGGKMDVGLDIISQLQSHWGVRCPVWVDNAEAFCHLPKMDCQMIKLVVSPNDPVLRVERP